MTIEEYIDIVWDFDTDLTEEEITQKLNELGVSQEEQIALGNEFLALWSNPVRNPNEPT
jgi:hypothetical protein